MDPTSCDKGPVIGKMIKEDRKFAQTKENAKGKSQKDQERSE